jgi:hypothetical protein
MIITFCQTKNMYCLEKMKEIIYKGIVRSFPTLIRHSGAIFQVMTWASIAIFMTNTHPLGNKKLNLEVLSK